VMVTGGTAAELRSSLWGHKPVTTKKKRGEEVDMWRLATMSKTKA
jgi:hypothetical protein